MPARLARWWLWLALASSLTLVALTARWRVQFFDRISAVTTGAAPADGAGGGRNRIVPALSFDALCWITYAQELATTDQWRIRETHLDNAPHGRAVHWSSGFAWWLVTLGHARKIFTGEPLPQAIEYAAAYANPALLLLALAGFALVVARRFGPAAGGLVALALAGSAEITVSFAANEPDHHGLINAAALGTVLFLAMGGAGWERRDDAEPTGLLPVTRGARRWFIASALCGAAGMWLSAASQIQVLAGAGLAAVAAIFLAGRAALDGPAVARPELWRTWGRWGAGASLAFYGLEYFPSHLGLRLEVNHPLYAAAWWGAAELLAALAAWRQEGAPLWPVAPRAQGWRIAAAVAVALPPLALAAGGARWFAPLDPFLQALPGLTVEGGSLLAQFRTMGFTASLPDTLPPVLALGLGLSALGARGLSRAERAAVLLPAVALLPVLMVSLNQGRWFLIAAALAIAAVPAGVVVWGARLPRWAGCAGLAVVATMLLGVFAVPAAREARRDATAALNGISPGLRAMLALRHLAQDLRARLGPAADPVILAGPDESILLAYYGRFRTVGTFYWENLAGLKTAAAIYTAPGLADAQRLLAAGGITHLFSFPAGNFVSGYAALVAGRPDAARAEQSFASLVFAKGQFPMWLRPLALNAPPELMNGSAVALFEFAPGQSEAEEKFYIARIALGQGRVAQAVGLLAEAARDRPTDAAIRFTLAQALAAGGERAAALAAARQAGRLAQEQGNTALAAEIARQLEAYSQETPAPAKR